MDELLNKASSSEIMQIRVKDLQLEIPIEYRLQIHKLFSALAQKNIKWRPHIWTADEWFSPDGVSGFAIPFVLCHPKLIQIEKEFLGLCEGEDLNEFFKLCCHETGHALDNAYRLRKLKRRQTLFGLSSKRYPRSYTPNPESNEYVEFLEDFYAQAHPDEDWAETFAYWLTRTTWNEKYLTTKAGEKLNYIEAIAKFLPHKPFKQNITRTPLHHKNDQRTFKEYLIEKRQGLKLGRHNLICSTTLDFVINTDEINAPSFSEFIFEKSQSLAIKLQSRSPFSRWALEKCLKDLGHECKNKNYRLKWNQERSEQELERFILNLMPKYIAQGRHRIYM